jgi:hypothetical protein
MVGRRLLIIKVVRLLAATSAATLVSAVTTTTTIPRGVVVVLPARVARHLSMRGLADDALLGKREPVVLLGGIKTRRPPHLCPRANDIHARAVCMRRRRSPCLVTHRAHSAGDAFLCDQGRKQGRTRGAEGYTARDDAEEILERLMCHGCSTHCLREQGGDVCDRRSSGPKWRKRLLRVSIRL